MVFYGTGEILVGEVIEFVQRAEDAGVDISLYTVPEGQHSFIMGAGRVPEADEAIERMGRWVRSRLSLDDIRHSVPGAERSGGRIGQRSQTRPDLRR